jgi:tRNA U34 2-thiouridine synthase MnmA/TrmU
MRNWDTRDEHATDVGCEWEKDWEDVQRVCQVLGVQCKMVLSRTDEKHTILIGRNTD